MIGWPCRRRIGSRTTSSPRQVAHASLGPITLASTDTEVLSLHPLDPWAVHPSAKQRARTELLGTALQRLRDLLRAARGGKLHLPRVGDHPTGHQAELGGAVALRTLTQNLQVSDRKRTVGMYLKINKLLRHAKGDA